MTPEIFGELRGTLELLLQHLGKFTDNTTSIKNKYGSR